MKTSMPGVIAYWSSWNGNFFHFKDQNWRIPNPKDIRDFETFAFFRRCPKSFFSKLIDTSMLIGGLNAYRLYIKVSLFIYFSKEASLI